MTTPTPSSTRDNLIKARAHFQKYGARSIEAAFRGAIRQDAPNALETLAALRAALPDGVSNFRSFESSRNWSVREAYRVFDRAIASQEPS